MQENSQNNPSRPSCNLRSGRNFIKRKTEMKLLSTTIKLPIPLALAGNSSPKSIKQTAIQPILDPAKYIARARTGIQLSAELFLRASTKKSYFFRWTVVAKINEPRKIQIPDAKYNFRLDTMDDMPMPMSAPTSW